MWPKNRLTVLGFSLCEGKSQPPRKLRNLSTSGLDPTGELTAGCRGHFSLEMDTAQSLLLQLSL
jgi:hypothetical protein